MVDFVENNMVYPILIRYNGESYLTLLYYNERSDAILSVEWKKILCFRSAEEMENFCKINRWKMEKDIEEYDFDAPIVNPIDYRRILNNWNLLNTIASEFRMFFEGDLRKYSELYDLLFGLNTPVEPISPTYDVGEKYISYILKVFRKKERFLGLFEFYQGE